MVQLTRNCCLSHYANRFSYIHRINNQFDYLFNNGRSKTLCVSLVNCWHLVDLAYSGNVSSLCVVDCTFCLLSPLYSYMIFNLPLSKLYTNSLLSSLNSRGGWRRNGSAQVASNSMGSFVIQNSPGGKQSEGRVDTGIPSIAKVIKSPIRQLWPDSLCHPQAINLLEPVRASSGKQQVFVHVESHEMGDEGCPNTRRAKHPDTHV